MDIDHTAIRLSNDATLRRMRGETIHGCHQFDVPYITQITPTLWMGGCMDRLVLPAEIYKVISLYPWEKYTLAPHQTRFEIQMYDSVDQDLSQVWEIADHVVAAQKGGSVLVHCQAGLNRSGLITAASLILQGVHPAVAIKRLRALRSPAVLCNPGFEHWLLTAVQPSKQS